MLGRSKPDLPGKTGLARALSKLGYCSRSQAAELIRTGRVGVNGAARRDPEFPARPGKDRIEVDGQTVEVAGKVYLALNKPRGVVSTASDEKGRKTVYAFLNKSALQDQERGPWVAPVGRLDKASEGLLLLTNDSEWAARVLAPETHLEKIYHVQIASLADARLLHAIGRGVKAEDGQVLRAKSGRILREGERNTWLEVVLDEGKNRQIRRIFEGLGIEVRRVVRVAIGPLTLGRLAKGTVRSLKMEEKEMLDRAMERAGAGRRSRQGDWIHFGLKPRE
jgi:23S rRNA pseudouridine2605 synthase